MNWDGINVCVECEWVCDCGVCGNADYDLESYCIIMLNYMIYDSLLFMDVIEDGKC